MPCYHPFTVYRLENGAISFKGKKDQGRGETLSLPCGRCIGCRLERSRQWAVRCMHEASLHEKNSYVTLTYNDAHVTSSLEYEHFQDFMRRLRYEFGKVRFYMCGEYGEENKRPHFHACLFGVDFDDKVFFFRTKTGNKLFRSRRLEALWRYGYSTVGAVTFESAAYVARYIMKKVTGDGADSHYMYVDPNTGEFCQRIPEFNRMSLKPGVGAGWVDKYESDIFPSGKVVVRGTECVLPRYYDKLLEKKYPDRFAEIRAERDKAARGRFSDNTDERLLVKERVRDAAILSLKKVL